MNDMFNFSTKGPFTRSVLLGMNIKTSTTIKKVSSQIGEMIDDITTKVFGHFPKLGQLIGNRDAFKGQFNMINLNAYVKWIKTYRMRIRKALIFKMENRVCWSDFLSHAKLALEEFPKANF